MQLTAALLMATPCDDEEENLATLVCHSDKGELFLMSRYPDEDRVDITLGNEEEYSQVEGLKVTLGANRLLIEVSALDTDALRGSDHLEILHKADAGDLAEIEETLKNILDGTGTYVSEL